jgi:hypothetical protein
MKKLTTTFHGHEKIDKFYSQAAQDLFVLIALDGKRDGFFMDIGCYDPIDISNSYLLETEFDWTGIMLDINRESVEKCKSKRVAICYCADAVTFDYKKALDDNHCPRIVDYISLDIDGMNTLHTLKALPLLDYEFRVMTFEHDAYAREAEVRTESRAYLESLGYVRICSDVSNAGCIYEDWYVNPKYVDVDRLSALMSDGEEWSNIIFKNDDI